MNPLPPPDHALERPGDSMTVLTPYCYIIVLLDETGDVRVRQCDYDSPLNPIARAPRRKIDKICRPGEQ